MYFRFVLTTNNNNIEFILFLCAMEAFLLQKLRSGILLPFTRVRMCPALPDWQKWKEHATKAPRTILKVANGII